MFDQSEQHIVSKKHHSLESRQPFNYYTENVTAVFCVFSFSLQLLLQVAMLTCYNNNFALDCIYFEILDTHLTMNEIFL